VSVKADKIVASRVVGITNWVDTKLLLKITLSLKYYRHNIIDIIFLGVLYNNTLCKKMLSYKTHNNTLRLQ